MRSTRNMMAYHIGSSWPSKRRRETWGLIRFSLEKMGRDWMLILFFDIDATKEQIIDALDKLLDKVRLRSLRLSDNRLYIVFSEKEGEA